MCINSKRPRIQIILIASRALTHSTHTHASFELNNELLKVRVELHFMYTLYILFA